MVLVPMFSIVYFYSRIMLFCKSCYSRKSVWNFVFKSLSFWIQTKVITPGGILNTNCYHCFMVTIEFYWFTKCNCRLWRRCEPVVGSHEAQWFYHVKTTTKDWTMWKRQEKIQKMWNEQHVDNKTKEKNTVNM